MDERLKARPTTYNGIKMRSRLEARFAAFLDRAGLEWQYELRAFASVRGQYLPDFHIDRIGTIRNLYVEIKGARTKREWPEMQQMHVILDSEPDASLAYLIEERAASDLSYWADLGIAGLNHWSTGGGIALCGCGRPRFFDFRHDHLSIEEMAGKSDEELSEPVVYCDCANPIVRAYLNPFARTT